jgi:mRNA-degrading endonuclease RelE of RelBE toxin-antitoxin system
VNEGGYAIAWTAPGRRALARLPEKVATSVAEFLYGSLAADPHRAGKPLRLGLSGLRSARRGDYRVIYRIDAAIRQLTVLAIEHRSDVYRPRQF